LRHGRLKTDCAPASPGSRFRELAGRPRLFAVCGPPQRGQVLKRGTHATGVGVVVLARDEAGGRQHVVGDRVVHIPEVGEAEAATVVGDPPGEQDVGGAAGLAGCRLALATALLPLVLH